MIYKKGILSDSFDVTLCKPCSVLPKKWQPFICISNMPFDLFISFSKTPLPNLGFSLVGFISFHSVRFHTDYVTVTLLKAFTIVSLRYQLSRQHYLPDLIDSISTNTTVIADCASMDFPLDTPGRQQLPEHNDYFFS